MSRREFSTQVRRDALKRSGMFCEALGAFYGLADGQRCNAPLGYGVQFDHIIADGLGGEPTLDNCAAVCLTCHRFKTSHRDTPLVAKSKRVSDRHLGIRKPRSSWPTGRDKPFKSKIGGGVVRRDGSS
ncbi:HNH endonuclease signature motif containing protein [Labrys sp. KB_33_2]|uniref:HNH endonuclease signature motif containing protein n=1 Tax=Labrys sp. KB_33_2 TaxID=3237479 RepID=UPI003F8E9C2F